MSRALDKELLSRLRKEDSAQVYKDIAKLLSSSSNAKLWEIEILGKHHTLEPGTSYLIDGNAVAVPKLRLIQGFFVARGIIDEYLQASTRKLTDEVVQATAVVMLMDAEHLTACNIRKRWVDSQLLTNDIDKKASILRQEKLFLDSLLTARLHRHTKSPTLWSHRRWLLQTFSKHGLSFHVEDELSSVVLVAAERHPRNYYAWDHARWMLRHSHLDKHSLQAAIERIKTWCLGHYDDVSGWNFLDYSITAIKEPSARPLEYSNVLGEVLDVTKSFRWTSESVWVFLRTIAVREQVSNALLERFELVLAGLLSTLDDGTKDKRVLEQTQAWFKSFCRQR